MLRKFYSRSQNGISRRRFLGWSAGALAAAATVSIAGVKPARAAKVKKSAVMYQNAPKGSRKCAGCKFFQADKNACERVEGEISAEGWCAIWQKK